MAGWLFVQFGRKGNGEQKCESDRQSSESNAGHFPLCSNSHAMSKNSLDCEAMLFPGSSENRTEQIYHLAERYRYVKALGHGAFGEVMLAEDTQTGQQVAVKQLYLPEPGAPLPPAVAREVAALQQLQHPNIIGLLDMAASGCCVFLCQELCCTDLAAVLAAADHQLPPQWVCRTMQQLLSALAACHAAGIMHRDVKPSNILITPSGSIKLADFGLAKRFSRQQQQQQQHTSVGSQDSSSTGYREQAAPRSHHHHHEQQQQQQHQDQQRHDSDDAGRPQTPAQGTRWYRAPELLYGSCSYGPEVDVWAAGCVLADMLGLSPLIPGQSDIEQLARMQHLLGSITPQEWPGVEQLPDWHKVCFAHSQAQDLAVVLPDAPPAALDLLRALLRYDPGSRLSAAEALEHAYFVQGGSTPH